MKYYVGPLEGITNRQYREMHRKYFPGADKYFTPFISPTQDYRFSPRVLKELLPELEAGVPLVPQLMANSAETFVPAAKELGRMGFTEVNFNLGCPSRTVTAKHKGSGLLRDPLALDALLDAIFTAVGDGLPGISVKTRLGIVSAEEFPALLAVFNRYPIAELTVHARVQEDFYRRPARPEALASLAQTIKPPFCYNGDILTAADAKRILPMFPSAEAVMLGRGLIADPALAGRLRGEGKPDLTVYRAFHDELLAAYIEAGWDHRSILCHMKEIWSYMSGLFADSERAEKRIRKATAPDSYRGAVSEMFQLPLKRNS